MKYIILLVLLFSFSTASAETIEELCESMAGAAAYMVLGYRNERIRSQMPKLTEELRENVRNSGSAFGPALVRFLTRVEAEAKNVKPGDELKFKDRVNEECKIVIYGALM